MQPGSPHSYRYNPSWGRNWQQARRQILKLKPDLLLVGGDLTRDGSVNRFELEEMRDDLAALPFPVLVVPGNMDTGNKHTRDRDRHRGPGQCRDIDLNVTSEQLRGFEEVFGPVCRTVLHKGVRFTAFADTVVNSGLPEEEAFFEWAEGLKALPRAGHHVWILHYPLFADRPDEPTWDIATRYREWYFTIDEPGRTRLL